MNIFWCLANYILLKEKINNTKKMKKDLTSYKYEIVTQLILFKQNITSTKKRKKRKET